MINPADDSPVMRMPERMFPVFVIGRRRISESEKWFPMESMFMRAFFCLSARAGKLLAP
jgi:hypothetical protein